MVSIYLVLTVYVCALFLQVLHYVYMPLSCGRVEGVLTILK